MQKRDIHETYDFFEYAVAAESDTKRSENRIDVALLDMHHGWPNVGHNSLVHAILDLAEECAEALRASGTKIRVISFDVRQRMLLPELNGRFALFIGTGGPGQLDPRLNDGVAETSQGIRETDAWEAPLFRLFDYVYKHGDAALLAVCHSFGLLCRWAGIAKPMLRSEKSSGVPVNVLSDAALDHPWFSQFAAALPDHEHFRVVDNRLFDLVVSDTSDAECLAFEKENSAAMTMVEIARDPGGLMPRILGVNHHPEIIDRAHVLAVLEEKHDHHEVSDDWYRERTRTMEELLRGETERQSRLTSEFTLIGPLRHHVRRLVGERCGHSYQISIS